MVPTNIRFVGTTFMASALGQFIANHQHKPSLASSLNVTHNDVTPFVGTTFTASESATSLALPWSACPVRDDPSSPTWVSAKTVPKKMGELVGTDVSRPLA